LQELHGDIHGFLERCHVVMPAERLDNCTHATVSIVAQGLVLNEGDVVIPIDDGPGVSKDPAESSRYFARALEML